MVDTCSSCPGGSNLVHRTNPNPDIEVIVTEGNVVLHPQRLDPARVPFDALHGFSGLDVGALFDGRDYVLRWSDTRVYDDDGAVVSGECGFVVSEPGDCLEFEWSPADGTEPPVTGAELPGAFAVNTATDCVTHVFCNGRWLCVAGASTPVTGGGGGTGNQIVCYPDLSGQSYSAGAGEWLVFGVDQMAGFTCGDERVTVCPTGLETSTEYGTYNGAGPGGGWGSIGWDTITGAGDEGTILDGCDTVIRTHTSGDPRREFRIDFGVPSGAGGPLNLSFNHTESSGAFRVAAWDSISNTTLDATLISGPSGTSVQAGPTGDVVEAASGQAGAFAMQFDYGTADPANVRIIVWNMGGSTPEALENFQIEYTQSGEPGCFEWPTLNSLASWLTSNDPNGATWAVDGNEVCTTVGPGQAAAYGNLAGQDNGATPTVTDET